MYINRLDLKVDDHKNSAIFNVFDEAAQDCFLRYHVQMELDYILTFKLKGEDIILESAIPYAIVGPCALTEEPAGADLIFDQGDNIMGKISREEIVRMCVAPTESHSCLMFLHCSSVMDIADIVH
ncbi:unnamed protein product [Trifolium pratense]|uniref:Uncharacterized protein n=1 Tax=Trifolium pratense TaxID=57577 RepID=A0ACB0L0F3_TRIPR|nr:unnamed protein product [Trifolium pratense]